MCINTRDPLRTTICPLKAYDLRSTCHQNLEMKVPCRIQFLQVIAQGSSERRIPSIILATGVTLSRS
eukprot:c10113_g1_i1 orf=2-199(-)